MSRAVRVLSALLLVMVAAPSTAVAERCPCDLLLLPYFEVQLPGPGHEDPWVQKTTNFAVGNHGDEPVVVELVLWTNWGILVHRSTIDLEAKAVLTVSLRDWLMFGSFPEGDLGAEELDHLQAALAGLPSPLTGLYYATPVAERLLVGYLTARVVSGAHRPGVLWGDVFMLHDEDDLAAGESLVRLVHDQTREVCERHLLRFLQGGGFDAGTHFVVWSGARGWPSADPDFPGPGVDAHCDIYDEAGNWLGEQDFNLMATQAIEVGELGWPEPFGWVDCTTETPTFVCTGHTAHGSHHVLQRSFCPVERAEYEPRPQVQIEKATNGVDADLPPGPMVTAGDEVEWTYVVTNTGERPLHDVAVTDDKLGAIDCPETELHVGERMTCTAYGPVPAGQYRNEGIVAALDPDGHEVDDADPSHCYGEEPVEPAIGIEKATNGHDADLPPGPTLVVGSAVAWTYVVSNSGNVPLTNVAVVDDQGVVVSCPSSSLAVGASMTCTASGIAVAGQYANLGTATGVDPAGTQVSASDPSHYFCEEPPDGDQGCTPGYWKNHPDSWPATGYAPADTVAGVFAEATAYLDLASATLIEALDFGGGPGVEGAARILLRAAVAALLNAAHSGVDYPWTASAVVSTVNAALASGDRDTMLALASALDADNNLGCPLN